MLTRCKKRSPQTLTVTFFIGFSVIHVSQGSVATYVRCGGISAQHCIANFLLSLPVKEFLKSVQIWQSYLLPKFVGLVFFETACAATWWMSVKMFIISLYYYHHHHGLWRYWCCHLVSVGENVNYFIVLSSSSQLVTVLVVLPPGECRWKYFNIVILLQAARPAQRQTDRVTDLFLLSTSDHILCTIL